MTRIIFNILKIVLIVAVIYLPIFIIRKRRFIMSIMDIYNSNRYGKYLFKNRYYYHDKEYGWYIIDNDEKISVIPPNELDSSCYIGKE